MKTLLCIVVASTVVAGTAAAQERVNETRPASPTGTVEIVNTAGSVRVVGWNRNEVQVTGTLGRGVERLDFATEGDRTRVRVVLPREARNVQRSDLEIRVPARSNPQVRTTSADIEVSGVGGAIDARSTSGSVTISGNAREVAANSTSGRVEITGERLQTLKAGTVSGAIRLRGSSGSVEAESVSGAVDISVATPQARAKTVSGPLTVRGVSGIAEASTVSGEATVEGGRFSRMSLSSVSGGLRFQGDVERGGLYHLNSHSGRIVVRLPAAVAADFEVNTFSGNITNEFGPGAVRVSQYGPGRELRFTAGQGGARVVAKTFSGNVTLARQ
jgi:hypothetical protein